MTQPRQSESSDRKTAGRQQQRIPGMSHVGQRLGQSLCGRQCQLQGGWQKAGDVVPRSVQISNQPAIENDDPRSGDSMRTSGFRSFRPWQRIAPRIRRICGRQHDGSIVFHDSNRPKVAQPVFSSDGPKLGGSQTRNKIASTNSARFFHRFQRVRLPVRTAEPPRPL